MPAIGLDFETRSKTAIKCGVYNYATCPTTSILCLSVICEETGKEWLWYPADGALPADLITLIETADIVKAHNAAFDRAIWEYVAVNDNGFPELTSDVWYCTSAQCRVNALPASLENAARALGLEHRKDRRGAALIKILSIPDKVTDEFTQDSKALLEMGEYCLQDSRLMLQVSRRCRALSTQERADWAITETLNERGVRIDTELAELAIGYAEDEKDDIAKRLYALTEGEVSKHSQSKRLLNWVLQAAPQLLEYTSVLKEGVPKQSFDKAVRAAIIEAADTGSEALPPSVLEVVILADQGNKSSVAKFQRMLDVACPEDNRARGAFVFAGAGQTQRFASRGLQLHNMRRDCWNASEVDIIKANMRDDLELDDVMNTLSKLIRPTLLPEKGHEFVVGDWSAIEARVLPWLTDAPRAEVVLDVFRSGGDIYMHTAAQLGIDERQTGKVATLALGYQGSLGAFNVMARAYNLTLPESYILKLVKAWRFKNPWAVDFWALCERQAKLAIRHPGTLTPVGKCNFVFVAGLMGGTLCALLPDNTMIQYPRARVENVDTPRGMKAQITYMKASILPKADAKHWPRHTLYGGLITENLTQAVAGCLLKNNLRELPDVVMHLHDEIVLEVPSQSAKPRAHELQQVMETPPPWAQGLPLKAEPEIFTRYGK